MNRRSLFAGLAAIIAGTAAPRAVSASPDDYLVAGRDLGDGTREAIPFGQYRLDTAHAHGLVAYEVPAHGHSWIDVDGRPHGVTV